MPPKAIFPSPPNTEGSKSLSDRAKSLRETSCSSSGEPIQVEELRMGAPAPLFYLPSSSRSLPNDDPFSNDWNNTIKQSVINILRANGVNMADVSNIEASDFEVHHPSDPRYDPYFVIRVTLTKPAIDDTWYVCVDVIRKLLRDKYWGQVAVEFIDPRLLEYHCITPIEKGDPIIAAWNRSIRAAVMRAIEPLEWNCVAVFRKTQSEQEDEGLVESPITISIALTFEQRIGTWRDAEGQIRQACDQEGYSTSTIKIEFIYAEVHPNLDQQRSSGAEYEKNYFVAGTRTLNPRTIKMDMVRLDTDAYASAPGMGFSLGANRTETLRKGPTGTLGGYVELFDDAGQSQGVYGMTCWHVARAAINPLEKAPGEGPGSLLTNYDQNGVKPADHDRHTLEMFQPSQTDHNETMLSHDLAVEDAAKDVVQTVDLGARQRRIEDWDEAVAERKKLRERHAALKRGGYFGHVFAASGLRRHNQTQSGKVFKARTDWALIQVDGEGRSVGLNILPDRNAFPASGISMKRLHPTASQNLMKQMTSTETGSVDSYRGFKKGKTTGLTVGRFNGIKAEVKIKNFDAQTPGLGSSQELVYMGNDPKDPFSLRGDSGAFVYNSDGAWFGIVMGGCVAQKVSYITDARAIRDDIKRVTGFGVRLPQ